MKKIFKLVIISFIVIILILVYNYITLSKNVTINKDFEEYLSNAKKLTSFEENFTIVMTMFYKNNIKNASIINGTGTIYMKNDKNLNILHSTHGCCMETFTKEYYFQDKTYVCYKSINTTTNKILFNWQCLYIKDSSHSRNYKIGIKMLESLYNKSVFIFESERNNIVSGMNCKEIKIKVNISRLNLDDKRFLLGFAYYTNKPRKELIESIKAVDISLCIDPLKGIVLQKDISIVMDKNRLEKDDLYKIETRKTVNSFISNPEISDKVFGLPTRNFKIISYKSNSK